MIILGTHIWVRWVDPEANPLPPAILKRSASADQLAVSAITCWEVAWLQRRGRWQRQPNLNGWFELASPVPLTKAFLNAGEGHEWAILRGSLHGDTPCKLP